MKQMILKCAAVYLLAALSCMQAAFAQSHESAPTSAAPLSNNGRLDAKTLNESAKSLKDVLERAEAQGLIQIRKSEDGNPPSQTVPQPHSPPRPEPMSAASNPIWAKACKGTNILNFSELRHPMSYSDLMALKSDPGDLNIDSNRLGLIEHYLAYGLGTEAIVLAANHVDHADDSDEIKATFRFIPAMGRAIEGNPEDDDLNLLAAHLACRNQVDVWYMSALVMRPARLAKEGILKVTPDVMLRAEAMPPHLAELFQIRLAQYAAETGDNARAHEILAKIAPETANGHLDTARPADVQYLYALVNYGAGDAKALAILQREAQGDGLYKQRALRLLAKYYDMTDTAPYPGFDMDMQSVKQVFVNEETETLFADVSIIKAANRDGQMKAAIAMAREKLPLGSAERKEAVADIAESLEKALGAIEIAPRLGALDVYVGDEDFFEIYSRLAELKAAAINAALDLHMPELAAQIAQEETIAGVELAQAKIAIKKQDYSQVEKLAQKYPDNPDFQKLRIDAALRSERFDRAALLIADIADPQLRLTKLSDMSWKQGQWQDAAINLDSLRALSSEQDPVLEARSELAQIMAAPPSPSLRGPANTDSLEQMTQDMRSEIDIIKGYLSNG